MATRYKIRTEKEISDAALIVLGNTSGINSGDQVADGTTITGAGTVASPFISTGATTTYVNSASAEAYGQSVVYSRQRWIDINRCGLMNQTETTISFDGTDTFTLGSVGATWSYYRAGIKYTITGPKSVVVATPMVDSTFYFIYIDSTDGSLTSSTSAWTLNDTKIPVATIFWDSTQTPQYHMAEERHTILIDRRMHYYEHFYSGTVPKSVGAVAGYVLNTDTNIAKTFAVSASSILDEDIIFNLASFPQPNGTTADYPVMYRTAAGTWKWKQSNMPFVYNVGNTNNWIQYDVNGTMTDATGGGGGSVRYVNSYLCMTNLGSAHRYVIIPGRAQFTSLALAQAENPSTFSFAGFPSGEFFIAYQLTWTTLTSGQTGQCRLAAIPKRISVAAVQTSQTGVSVDHNTLAGLQGGVDGEYYHLTSTQLGMATSAATASATGLLTNTDWTTFNNKAGTVSPVFTGTVATSALKMTMGASADYVMRSDATGVARWDALSDYAKLASPVFTGTISVSAFKMATGASSGDVFTSDAVGVGRWAAPTGGGITWSAVTSDGDLAADTGTLANKNGLLTLTLPATCALGKTIRVGGMNAAGSWRISQNASQIINFNSTSSTAGTGGYIASTLPRDAVELVCTVADTEFNVISSTGNITVI